MKDRKDAQRKVKKLTLTKESLRVLDEQDLKAVVAGATGTRPCSFCTAVCSACLPCA